MVVTLESTICPNENVLCTLVDGEMIIFDPETGFYFGLDEIGVRIWELAKEEKSVSLICENLVLEFDVEMPICKAHVLEFLNSLFSRKLIEILQV